MGRTEVHITIDTEFSAGGCLVDPVKNPPIGPRAVYCPVDGTSEGLGRFLGIFGEHGVRGTFFVETANTHYFGDEPMGGIAREIHEAGHDVQLHVHPLWFAFRGGKDPECVKANFPGDSMANRTPDFLAKLLGHGIDTFARWGVPRPIAARAGNLQADRAVYAAMRELGLPVASHIGLGYNPPPEPELHLHGGRHNIDGVVELPVLTYADRTSRRPGGRRILTITGATFSETVHLLETAHRQGLEQVVILSHCHELAKYSDYRFRRITRNRVNQRRLDRLCAWLARNRDRFESGVGFADRASAWTAAPDAPEPSIDVPVLSAVKRMVINKANDALWCL